MKKKHFLLPVMVMCTMTGCAQSPQSSSNPDARKVLVVYYSYSGNTKEMAAQIQEATGGDIFEIIPVNAYPEEYTACTEQAKREIEAGFKPPLKSKIENVGDYDIIFVGTPNWWSTIAPPVATFLTDSDLSGKTVIPFCTHGGGGQARCFTDMHKLIPKSNLSKGLAVSGDRVKSSNNDITTWLREIKVID